MMGRSVWTLNRQNLSIERYRVRGADHPTSKSQPPQAKAPRGHDVARACHDGPDAIVRHAAAFFAFAAARSLTNCKGFVRKMWGRAMRAGIVAGCVGLALQASGCSDYAMVRDGIGVNLAAADLPEASRLQDLYVGEICNQAGLRVTRQGDFLYCEEVAMRPAEWMTFVQAGMNDIDRRCDGYLAWLDNKRRWREPILKQLHTTAATAGAIMGLTGVGAVPIAIVGTAFGFAQDTFVNYNTRLVTEIDHSVLQTVVLDNQNQFRIKVAGTPVDNRPAAIYLLRNYLRICMPFSIEMSINNTMTVYHRGGPDALRTEPLLTQAPSVARITASRPAIIRDVNTPLKPFVAQPTISDTRIGPFEERMSRKDMNRVLTILCSETESDLGPANSQTRSKLSALLTANRKSASTRVTNEVFIILRELQSQGKASCS